MDEVSLFEKFFRTELLEVPELVECIADRLSNSVAPAGLPFPRAVYTIVPLNDTTGQARTSIQTRLLADLKIISTFPLPETVGPAVQAVKEHFRSSFTYDYDNLRISVRHERPISFIEPGAAADEKLLNRGGTFRVWITRL